MKWSETKNTIKRQMAKPTVFSTFIQTLNLKTSQHKKGS